MNSGGFEKIGFAVLLGAWSLLLVVGFILFSLGSYRKFSGQSWKPFFIPGAVLIVALLSLTLLNPDFYFEISGKGLFSIFTRSFVFILPITLVLFGGFLCGQVSTRFAGALFIVAGLLGTLSCTPFFVDALLTSIYGETTFTVRGMTRLSLPFLQQLGFLRILAETAGLIGLFSYFKHVHLPPGTPAPQPEKPLFRES